MIVPWWRLSPPSQHRLVGMPPKTSPRKDRAVAMGHAWSTSWRARPRCLAGSREVGRSSRCCVEPRGLVNARLVFFYPRDRRDPQRRSGPGPPSSEVDLRGGRRTQLSSPAQYSTPRGRGSKEPQPSHSSEKRRLVDTTGESPLPATSITGIIRGTIKNGVFRLWHHTSLLAE